MSDEIEPPRHQDTKPAIPPLYALAEKIMNTVATWQQNGVRPHATDIYYMLQNADGLSVDECIQLRAELAAVTEQRNVAQGYHGLHPDIAARFLKALGTKHNELLEESVMRVVAERDALQIQHGTCSVCGFIAWKERGKQQDCQYCAIVAERDSLKEEIEHYVEQGLIIKEEEKGL